MLRWPCREADKANWWWGCKGDAGSQMGLKTGKGKWRRLGKVLGEIFLVFVTNSDGMLWWRTSEKRAPIAWKQFCKALTEVCRTKLPADCLHCEHRWIQWLSKHHCCQEARRTAFLEHPLLISLFISAVIMQNLCPAILKAVDGAIDSTINAYVNQVKVYLYEQY